MAVDVRLRNGIEVGFASGDGIVLDGRGTGDATVLSHAHGDHLVGPSTPVVASDLTVDLAGVRLDAGAPTVVDHPAVELHNAGHIAGSRAAVLTDPGTDQTVLYTGDCCTRDRFYLDGFTPVDADVLIVETTYGSPAYSFPPTDVVVTAILDWLEETMDAVVLLFGYALGRAQKLQCILAESPRSRVFVTDAISRLNAVIETHLDVSFDARCYGSDVDLEPGDVLVVPMQTTRLAWVESLIETHDAVTAGFSGWATDRSFVHRRGFDKGFVLSDHCDFDELVELVEAVDPDRVYTHHGFAGEFAQHLTSEYGYKTRALKRNQSTLGNF